MTFTDVTRKAGVTDTGLYHGFTVVFDDFNQDGKIDIFVANDSDPNYLYLNQGNGVFKEAALPSGVAFSGDGQTQANMGVAVGDFDNDGLIDVLTTTFSEDYFPLFKQQSPGLYEDVSAQAGLATVTLPWVGWACGFADLDNDGHKDLWAANGHVYPNADRLGTTSYLQSVAVLANRGGKFVTVPNVLGSGLQGSFRGGCAGDFNNDGRIDLLVLPIAGRPLLLENKTESHLHWIGFQLRGSSRNRDGIGAQRCASSSAAAPNSKRCGMAAVISRETIPEFISAWALARKWTASLFNGPAAAGRCSKTWPADRYLTVDEPL